MSVDVDDPEVLRAEARRKRRAFAMSPLSPFVRTMQQCMRDYLAARANGVSYEDAVRGIDEVVRAVWPVRHSKFPLACQMCDDIGWRVLTCWHGLRCGRYRCSLADPEWEHTYVVPCGCAKGDPFRRSGQQPRATPEDDLAAAGKTKGRKRLKGFSRITDGDR
jgi:hypothetical protein